MKNIITITFALFFFIQANAQSVTDKQNFNPSLDKFTGSWIWTSGKDTLRIIIRKENITLPVKDKIQTDVAIGFHEYIKDGILIESSISHSKSSFNDNKYTLLGGNEGGKNDPTCTFSIKDLTKKKSGELMLTINSSYNELKWELDNYEGLHYGVFDPTFTFPEKLILRKQ